MLLCQEQLGRSRAIAGAKHLILSLDVSIGKHHSVGTGSFVLIQSVSVTTSRIILTKCEQIIGLLRQIWLATRVAERLVTWVGSPRVESKGSGMLVDEVLVRTTDATSARLRMLLTRSKLLDSLANLISGLLQPCYAFAELGSGLGCIGSQQWGLINQLPGNVV